MSYTAPSVDASSQTFANLQSKGVRGFVDGVIAAQSPAMTANAVYLTEALLTSNQAFLAAVRLNNINDQFTGGSPVDVTSVETALFDLQYAFGVIAAAIGEIGTLVDANQGTLAFQTDVLTGKEVRTFP